MELASSSSSWAGLLLKNPNHCSLLLGRDLRLCGFSRKRIIERAHWGSATFLSSGVVVFKRSCFLSRLLLILLGSLERAYLSLSLVELLLHKSKVSITGKNPSSTDVVCIPALSFVCAGVEFLRWGFASSTICVFSLSLSLSILLQFVSVARKWWKECYLCLWTPTHHVKSTIRCCLSSKIEVFLWKGLRDRSNPILMQKRITSSFLPEERTEEIACLPQTVKIRVWW
jgi:hypothetical protein